MGNCAVRLSFLCLARCASIITTRGNLYALLIEENDTEREYKKVVFGSL
jgi:hypothetical protein